MRSLQSGDNADQGNHLAVSGEHDHDHVHETQQGPVRHSHSHRHRLDGLHMEHDSDHQHRPEHVPPVKARTVIKRQAMKSGGHDPEQVAAAYRAAGDEVVLSLSRTEEGDPVYMAKSDEGSEVSPDQLVQLTAQAEVELAAAITDPVAADTAAGEIFRYTKMATDDQLRAAGRRF